MPNSHHFMYLNVGCVRVRVSVTEAGRDLFMHNKSIWLIIKGVWDLFPLFFPPPKNWQCVGGEEPDVVQRELIPRRRNF